jgi:hypothetical protein
MATGNGHANGHGGAAGGWGLDGPIRRAGAEDRSSASGRRFVVAGLVVTVVIWGGVYLAFLSWRASYRALAEFGAARVAPLVDPLADRVPTGVDPTAWRSAVADTRAMLVALTASGLLGRAQMEALRDDVSARVDRALAAPGAARDELARLWDEMERKAGPAMAPDSPVFPHAGRRRADRRPRPPRPELLRPRPGA